MVQLDSRLRPAAGHDNLDFNSNLRDTQALCHYFAAAVVFVVEIPCVINYSLTKYGADDQLKLQIIFSQYFICIHLSCLYAIMASYFHSLSLENEKENIK